MTTSQGLKSSQENRHNNDIQFKILTILQTKLSIKTDYWPCLEAFRWRHLTLDAISDNVIQWLAKIMSTLPDRPGASTAETKFV